MLIMVAEGEVIVVEVIDVVVVAVMEDKAKVVAVIQTSGVGYHATTAVNLGTLRKTVWGLRMEPKDKGQPNTEVLWMGTKDLPEWTMRPFVTLCKGMNQERGLWQMGPW